MRFTKGAVLNFFAEKIDGQSFIQIEKLCFFSSTNAETVEIAKIHFLSAKVYEPFNQNLKE